LPWWLWLIGAVIVVLAGGSAVALRLRRNPRAREVMGRFRALSWRRRFRVARGIAGDRRVPLGARLLFLLLIGYVVFPIDLIPDVIPVIGQLDDLLVAGIAIWLLLRSVPPAVLDEHLRAAAIE
jgi:uncharacterized membrane protein YkvA (DUF1232 family)